MTKHQKIINWLVNGETGLSSKTMAATAAGVPVHDMNYPYDPSDLNRCRRLLLAVPEVKGAFPKIAELSPVWKLLIARWDELIALLEKEMGENQNTGMAPKTYDLLKQIRKEGGEP